MLFNRARVNKKTSLGTPCLKEAQLNKNKSVLCVPLVLKSEMLDFVTVFLSCVCQVNAFVHRCFAVFLIFLLVCDRGRECAVFCWYRSEKTICFGVIIAESAADANLHHSSSAYKSQLDALLCCCKR